MREQLIHQASLDNIQGRSIEEKLEWIEQIKKEYSKPRTRRTKEQLQKEFPKGVWQKDTFKDPVFGRNLFPERSGLVFVTEDPTELGENAKRIFNENGHEVERYKYKKIGLNGLKNPFEVYWRSLSQYDDDGYLLRHIRLELWHSVRSEATYDTRPDGSKILSHITTQSIERLPDITPGMLYGDKIRYDIHELINSGKNTS
jgi:hypothetical protein